MAKQSNLYLWWKNIRGTLYGGYEGANLKRNKGAPIVWFFHTILLPITLSLGALTKTLIDMGSRRNQLDSKVLEEKKKKIDLLNVDDVHTICSAIQATNPSSLSSIRLKKTLQQLDEERQAQEKHFQNQEEAVKRIAITYAALKKDVIKEYFMSSANNGKSTHTLLVTNLDSLTSNDRHAAREEEILEPPSFEFEGFVAAVDEELHNWELDDRYSCAKAEKRSAVSRALQRYRESSNASTYNQLRLALDFQRPVSGQGYKNTHSKTDTHGEVFNRLFFAAPNMAYSDHSIPVKYYPLHILGNTPPPNEAHSWWYKYRKEDTRLLPTALRNKRTEPTLEREHPNI